MMASLYQSGSSRCSTSKSLALADETFVTHTTSPEAEDLRRVALRVETHPEPASRCRDLPPRQELLDHVTFVFGDAYLPDRELHVRLVDAVGIEVDGDEDGVVPS